MEVTAAIWISNGTFRKRNHTGAFQSKHGTTRCKRTHEKFTKFLFRFGCHQNWLLICPVYQLSVSPTPALASFFSILFDIHINRFNIYVGKGMLCDETFWQQGSSCHFILNRRKTNIQNCAHYYREQSFIKLGVTWVLYLSLISWQIGPLFGFPDQLSVVSSFWFLAHYKHLYIPIGLSS